MVVDRGRKAAEHDRVFHALADPTRRDIVRTVLRQEQTVSQLAARYPMSFAAVQKHVAVLEAAELVSKEARGRERVVRGRIEGVRRADQLLDELESLWRARLQRFGEVLDDDDRTPNPPTARSTRA